LIRSRRRRALLRDGGSKPSTHPYAWIRSLDPERTLGRGPPGSASSERPPSRVKADQTELTVSVIRLGKTVLVVPSPRRAPLEGSHPRDCSIRQVKVAGCEGTVVEPPRSRPESRTHWT